MQGFTLGVITIARRAGGPLSLPVCNEFMAVHERGRLLAAFPDVIAMFDRATKLPLVTGEVKSGQEVALVVVPGSRLVLGSTMRDYALLRPIERLLNFRFRGSKFQVLSDSTMSPPRNPSH